MQTEGNSLVQLELSLGLTVDDQPQKEPTIVQSSQEILAWQEFFPVEPPSDVVIFPKGTTIYRPEGEKWGRISSGDRGKDVVAIDLTDKIRFQPITHPLFLSLVSSSVFVEGRGKHEQVGGNFLRFRASMDSGLKDPSRTEVWHSWCREMHGLGFTWEQLRQEKLSKIPSIRL